MGKHRDDRKWTTSYSDSWADVKVPGKANADEFKIVADWCEEHGLEIVAKLLREVEAHIDYDEPKRAYGWQRGRQCNLYHFYPVGDSRNNNPTCGQRVLEYDLGDFDWYPRCTLHGLCRRCLERLRTIHAKQCAPALAAIERLLAEQGEAQKQ